MAASLDDANETLKAIYRAANPDPVAEFRRQQEVLALIAPPRPLRHPVRRWLHRHVWRARRAVADVLEELAWRLR